MASSVLERDEVFESAIRLDRDLKAAAESMTVQEVRYLVDSYYQIQRHRIAFGAQARTNQEGDEPHQLIAWLASEETIRESDIKLALYRYARTRPHGRWAMSITGIGPVITAGLLAHIDIAQCPTVGHIWRFAGLDPTTHWDKGVKRPWNAKLKRLAWLIGESFVKVQNSPNDSYGRLYVQRKALETERNEAGLFAEQAKASLVAKKYRDDTTAKNCYEAGKLPPARIHLRATRYAVKLFLSHYFMVGYWLTYNQLPPRPFVIEHMGHTTYIVPPHLEALLPEMLAALKQLGPVTAL
jgi:hypothetical protein